MVLDFPRIIGGPKPKDTYHTLKSQKRCLTMCQKARSVLQSSDDGKHKLTEHSFWWFTQTRCAARAAASDLGPKSALIRCCNNGKLMLRV